MKTQHVTVTGSHDRYATITISTKTASLEVVSGDMRLFRVVGLMTDEHYQYEFKCRNRAESVRVACKLVQSCIDYFNFSAEERGILESLKRKLSSDSVSNLVTLNLLK